MRNNKVTEGSDESGYWTETRISHASNYYINRSFSTEQEARDYLFGRFERSDNEPSAALFGIVGTEKNRARADLVPVYKTTKGFKLGAKPKPKGRSWDDFDVTRPSLSALVNSGILNGFDGYKVTSFGEVAISELDPTERHAITGSGPQKVEALARTLRDNEIFVGIIVDQDGTILDGHHRYYAIKDHLKMKTIPALVVNVNWGGDTW